jgi:hypothetical protein
MVSRNEQPPSDKLSEEIAYLGIVAGLQPLHDKTTRLDDNFDKFPREAAFDRLGPGELPPGHIANRGDFPPPTSDGQ